MAEDIREKPRPGEYVRPGETRVVRPGGGGATGHEGEGDLGALARAAAAAKRAKGPKGDVDFGDLGRVAPGEKKKVSMKRSMSGRRA